MNPLISMMHGVGGQRVDPRLIQSAKRMMGMLSAAKNPAAALRQAAGQNPMLGQVMSVVGNRDPKAVFFDLCKQNNINPDDILNQLK